MAAAMGLIVLDVCTACTVVHAYIGNRDSECIVP